MKDNKITSILILSVMFTPNFFKFFFLRRYILNISIHLFLVSRKIDSIGNENTRK